MVIQTHLFFTFDFWETVSWRSLFCSFPSCLLLRSFIVLSLDVPLFSSFGFCPELDFMFVATLVFVFLHWLLPFGGVNYFKKIVQCFWTSWRQPSAFPPLEQHCSGLDLFPSLLVHSHHSGISLHRRPGDSLIPSNGSSRLAHFLLMLVFWWKTFSRGFLT